jgi:hypothetical protein
VLTLQTRIRVDDVAASEIFDFLANPDDEAYRAWWPGSHLRFHLVARGDEHIGDVVYMDEYVGRRRLRMSAVVTTAIPGRRLDWQLKKGIKLPACLSLELEDHEGDVEITHSVRAGFSGIGGVLDPC